MTGILFYRNGTITTRHYAYIEKILQNFISNDELEAYITAYITAFTVYDSPIIPNTSRSEGLIYKKLVNYKSLKSLLNNEKYHILKIYDNFEKLLENEGLFYLQYGLALRAFNDQDGAYEKLRTARFAYPESPQIEHAYAQQQLIMARESESERIAMSLLEEAKEILLRLDNANIKINDGYPIVTLSEHHISILQALNKEDTAREIAGEYYARIQNKLRGKTTNNGSRLEVTAKKFLIYSTTGVYR